MDDSSRGIHVDQYIHGLLDAIQRNTLYIISILLLMVATAITKVPLVIASVKIPSDLIFYVAFIAVFLGYWNLARLSLKIDQAFDKLKATGRQLPEETLYLHPWLLSPFQNLHTRSPRFLECIPIALVPSSAAVIAKYLIRIFNESSALEMWASAMPHFAMVSIIWFLCGLIALFSMMFIMNFSYVIGSIGGDRWRFLELTIAIFLMFSLVDELWL